MSVEKYNLKNTNLDDIDSLVKEAFETFKTYNNVNDPDKNHRLVLRAFLEKSIALKREYSSFLFSIKTETKKVVEYFLYPESIDHPEYYNLYDELGRPEIPRTDFIKNCSKLQSQSAQKPNEIFVHTLDVFLGKGRTKKCYLAISMLNSHLTPCAFLQADIDRESGVRPCLKTEIKVSELIEEACAKDENANKNIATLTNISKNDNTMNFISPYCNKGELYKNFIKDRSIKNISYKNRKLMFFQLICGLNMLHSLGIYHRDIKPDNILVHFEKDGSIRVQITDFDWACFADSSEEEKKKLCGTKPYIDVDYIDYCKNKLNEDYELYLADVWSMGLVGYELLPCRSPPWFFSDEIGEYPQQNYIDRTIGKTWDPVRSHPIDAYQKCIYDNMLTDYKKRKTINEIKLLLEAIVP